MGYGNLRPLAEGCDFPLHFRGCRAAKPLNCKVKLQPHSSRERIATSLLWQLLAMTRWKLAAALRGRWIIAPASHPSDKIRDFATSPYRGGFDASHLCAAPKFPPQLGVPAEAQRKYPQGVCRIRSAAKLLTAALLGSVGKGGVPQGDFLRAKGSERSFSPKGGNGVHGLFDDAGNVSFADKGVHPVGVLIVRQDTSTAPPGRFHPPFGRISHAPGAYFTRPVPLRQAEFHLRCEAPQNTAMLSFLAAPMIVSPNSFASSTDSLVGMALLASTGTPARITLSTISTGMRPLV